MHISTVFATLALAATGLAVPTVHGSPADYDPDLFLAPTIFQELADSKATSSRDDVPTDDCGPLYNIENQTTDGSPLYADCLQIIENTKKGGEWRVTAFQGRIAAYKTCAIGAEDQSGGVLTVGNLDIADFIHAAKDWVNGDGKAGGKAWMNCRAFGDLEHKDTNPGQFAMYYYTP